MRKLSRSILLAAFGAASLLASSETLAGFSTNCVGITYTEASDAGGASNPQSTGPEGQVLCRINANIGDTDVEDAFRFSVRNGPGRFVFQASPNSAGGIPILLDIFGEESPLVSLAVPASTLDVTLGTGNYILQMFLENLAADPPIAIEIFNLNFGPNNQLPVVVTRDPNRTPEPGALALLGLGLAGLAAVHRRRSSTLQG